MAWRAVGMTRGGQRLLCGLSAGLFSGLSQHIDTPIARSILCLTRPSAPSCAAPLVALR